MLDGIALSDYRSIGSELQLIGPLSKLNFLVGKNNAGKSAVLLFLAQRLAQAITSAQGQGPGVALPPLDRHLGSSSGTWRFGLAMRKGGASYGAMLTRIGFDSDPRTKGLVDRLLDAPVIHRGTDVAWFIYEASWDANLSLATSMIVESTPALNAGEWAQLWSKLTSKGGGELKRDWVPETLRAISPVNSPKPDVTLIPAIRRIGDAGVSSGDDFSGIGIIDRLAQLQNPDYNQRDLRDRFDKINTTLEVPYDRKTILVHSEGRTLPIGNLGTGIHEVIILAVVATVLVKQVVCIEEPELHLHPTLQRKLARYLAARTDNQYVLSTHSAHLLDTPDATLLHVRQRDGSTIVGRAITHVERFSVARDLGYQASDLLQANSVIWVEGPSDRVYLRSWLQELDPSMVEGIQFIVMFYGGRLLSHLTATDKEVDEFISLLKLNRNTAVIMDSDRRQARSPLNQSKERVIAELEANGGLSWVTFGRAIENYVPLVARTRACRLVHPTVDRISSRPRYGDPLRCMLKDGKQLANVDKLRIAHEVIKNPADWELGDLKEMAGKLVDFIHLANRP